MTLRPGSSAETSCTFTWEAKAASSAGQKEKAITRMARRAAPKARRGWPHTGFQKGTLHDSRTGRGSSVTMRVRTGGQKPVQSGSATVETTWRTIVRRRASFSEASRQVEQVGRWLVTKRVARGPSAPSACRSRRRRTTAQLRLHMSAVYLHALGRPAALDYLGREP